MVAELLLYSGRYDEALGAYGWVLHPCKKMHTGGTDGGNKKKGNVSSSRGGIGSTET